MSYPEEPPGGRLPIGESPKWIAFHVFAGLGVLAASILLGLALPEDAVIWVRIFLTIAVLAILGSLASRYAPIRKSITKTELSYLRFAVLIISILGIAPSWGLSLLGGAAFLAWTFVERRRQQPA